MTAEDVELTCADCNNIFIFTVEDQAFFTERGYQTPKRCPQCREARRGTSNAQRANRQMHQVTCSRCGGSAEVPFVPRLDRPVYCADCYKIEVQA